MYTGTNDNFVAEILRAANVAKGSKPVDYAAKNRCSSKRIQEDERYRINEAFSNSTVLMRAMLEDKLADACGRRGEDLREVRLHLVLGL
jgi:hypothetical protein